MHNSCPIRHAHKVACDVFERHLDGLSVTDLVRIESARIALECERRRKGLVTMDRTMVRESLEYDRALEALSDAEGAAGLYGHPFDVAGV